jgi:hypothetical protein|tara:strand:+ start:15865 stop:17001 length:1137 start_codon:yes stop_codon:yes gene_type:complete
MKKLKGKSEIERMKEMMNIKSPKNSTPTTILKEYESPNGTAYGIVKENAHYYVMESTPRGYVHIDGRRNKKTYQHKSYSGALKQMNFLFSSLNEVYQNYEEGINLFEEKKYVVKVPKRTKLEQAPPPEVDAPVPPMAPQAPATPTPPQGGAPARAARPGLVKKDGAPSRPEPPRPEVDVDVDIQEPSLPGPTSTDDVAAPPSGAIDFDAEVSSIERELGGGEESPEKEIQSLTGKLGQALRQGEDQNLVDTELTKYVVNSVFSALNLGELTDEDKLDIIKKVKNAGTGEEEFGTPDTPQIGMPGGAPEEEDDTEMEIDGLDTGMDDELDLSGFEDFEDEEVSEDMLYGDGDSEERGGDIAGTLRSFVEKTVDSYLGNK